MPIRRKEFSNERITLSNSDYSRLSNKEMLLFANSRLNESSIHYNGFMAQNQTNISEGELAL